MDLPQRHRGHGVGTQVGNMEGPAPKGLELSAQGFNPGNPQNKWFGLKGREMRLPKSWLVFATSGHFGAESEFGVGGDGSFQRQKKAPADCRRLRAGANFGVATD
jgi:hypothetical protein